MNGTLTLTHKLKLPNGQTVELNTAELELVRDELDRLLGKRDYQAPFVPTPTYPRPPYPEDLRIWCGANPSGQESR